MLLEDGGQWRVLEEAMFGLGKSIASRRNSQCKRPKEGM